ncbi:hypothetical protein [Thermococcus sp.]
MCELKKRIEDALFEARPYLEYFDELREKIEELEKKATDAEAFLLLLNEEIEAAREPFKTDLRIFLQKFGGI